MIWPIDPELKAVSSKGCARMDAAVSEVMSLINTRRAARNGQKVNDTAIRAAAIRILLMNLVAAELQRRSVFDALGIAAGARRFDRILPAIEAAGFGRVADQLGNRVLFSSPKLRGVALSVYLADALEEAPWCSKLSECWFSTPGRDVVDEAAKEAVRREEARAQSTYWNDPLRHTLPPLLKIAVLKDELGAVEAAELHEMAKSKGESAVEALYDLKDEAEYLAPRMSEPPHRDYPVPGRRPGAADARRNWERLLRWEIKSRLNEYRFHLLKVRDEGGEVFRREANRVSLYMLELHEAGSLGIADGRQVARLARLIEEAVAPEQNEAEVAHSM